MTKKRGFTVSIFGEITSKLSGHMTWGRFLDCKKWAVRCSPTFFAAFCSAKVRRRRRAQLDRVISMTFAQRKTYEKSTPGVDFSYLYRWANVIEITLSNCALRWRRTFSLQIRAKNFGEQRIALLLLSRNRPLESETETHVIKIIEMHLW